MHSLSDKCVNLFLIVCIFCLMIFGDATICKPFSKFKIDCNICECSADGRKYSCTEKQCPLRAWSNFFEEINEDGYVLLKPKQADQKSEEDDFVLTRKNRQN